MDDIVKDFLIESKDNLDRLDQELVKLETDPNSTELLGSIFRTIHTIKGTCGFLAFSHLEKVAHAGENLLSKLRDKELQLNAEITNGLLAMVDAVRHMLGEIESTEHDGDNEYPELIERLKKLQQAGKSQAETKAEIGPPLSTSSSSSTKAGNLEPREEHREPAERSTPPSAESAANHATNMPVARKKSRTAQFRPAAGKIGGLLVERGAIRPEDLAVALQEQESGDRRRLGEILVALGLCRQEEVDTDSRVAGPRDGGGRNRAGSRGCARHAHESCGRVGIGAQPASAVCRQCSGRRLSRGIPAHESDCYRVAGTGHEDSNAAHRKCLEQVSSYGAGSGP
jgi:two-component system, chemotaxis family, sensor kinase CheA